MKQRQPKPKGTPPRKPPSRVVPPRDERRQALLLQRAHAHKDTPVGWELVDQVARRKVEIENEKLGLPENDGCDE